MRDDVQGELPHYITQKGQLPDPFLLTNSWERLLHTDTGGRWWRTLSQVPAGNSGGGDPPGARRVVSAGSTGRHFLVPTKLGFFESVDGGFHWKNINKEFPEQNGTLYFQTVSDPQSGILVVTTEHYGMFVERSP